jgi:hypothetical protein
VREDLSEGLDLVGSWWEEFKSKERFVWIVLIDFLDEVYHGGLG